MFSNLLLGTIFNLIGVFLIFANLFAKDLRLYLATMVVSMAVIYFSIGAYIHDQSGPFSIFCWVFILATQYLAYRMAQDTEIIHAELEQLRRRR